MKYLPFADQKSQQTLGTRLDRMQTGIPRTAEIAPSLLHVDPYNLPFRDLV